MSGIVSASINPLSCASSAARGIFVLSWGILESIEGIEGDEDFVVLSVGGQTIEAPAKLADNLRPLIGRNISIVGRKDFWSWGRRPT